MARFILRYTGDGKRPDADVAQVRSTTGVTIVDDSSSRMLLVEGAESELKKVMEGLSNWVMSAETFTKVPDPRPRVQE